MSILNKISFLSIVIIWALAPIQAKIPLAPPGKALVLIDGRPVFTASSFRLIKVDDTNNSISTKFFIGDKKSSYTDPSNKRGHFFFYGIVDPGYYLLSDFGMTGGIASVEICHDGRAPLFKFEEGKINIIPRTFLNRFELSSFVSEDGLAVNQKNLESQDIKSNALSAIGGDTDLSKDLNVVFPLKFYTIRKPDGSVGRCARSGTVVPID